VEARVPGNGIQDDPYGNSGGQVVSVPRPGAGRAPRRCPVITELAGLEVRTVALRHKTAVERWVEIVPAAGGDPVISLLASDAGALAYMLRRHAAEATR